MTGTWRLATQPASGAAIRIASRCSPVDGWLHGNSGIPPLNLTQVAVEERVQHELLVVGGSLLHDVGEAEALAPGRRVSEERPR